jgi:hypothetical protein
LAVGAAGLAAWAAYGGVEGPRQVLTMRGAEGWQLESLPGSILRSIWSQTVFFDAGAWRAGHASALWRTGLLLVGLAVIVAVWRRAWRTGDPFGSTPLVVVVALLVTGPLLSPQFLLWLLPAAAILPTDRLGERAFALAMVATGLTSFFVTVMPSIIVGTSGGLALVLVRNLVLLGVLQAAWRTTRGDDRGGDDRGDGDRGDGGAATDGTREALPAAA